MNYLKKNQIKIKVTFSTVTPESASIGDFSETGWIDKKGIVFDSCQDAAKFLVSEGVQHASSSEFHHGIWYSTEFHQDIHDGSETEQSYHIECKNKQIEIELYNRVIGID